MIQLLPLLKHLFRLMRKYFWVLVLLLLIGHFIHQSSFSWEESDDLASHEELTNEEEVVFIVIKEEFTGVKKNGFDSLSDSLKTWEFDRRDKKLYLKYKKDLPYTMVGEGRKQEFQFDKTKVIVLYDRGFDSFERYSEILAISSLPYKYHFKDEPLIAIHSVDADGTVFLEFKGKPVQLKAGDEYPEVTLKGYQLVRTEVQNHGIYHKKQFVPLEEENGEPASDGLEEKPADADDSSESDSEQGTPPPLPKPLPNIHS